MGLQLHLRRQSGWFRRWCESRGCLPLQGSVVGKGQRAIIPTVDMPARCVAAFAQLGSSFARRAVGASNGLLKLRFAAQDGV